MRRVVGALGPAIDDYVARARPGTELGPLDDALAVCKTARDRVREPRRPQAGECGRERLGRRGAPRATCAVAPERLQKFVDLVKAAVITLGLTKYAQDLWPYKPREFVEVEADRG